MDVDALIDRILATGSRSSEDARTLLGFLPEVAPSEQVRIIEVLRSMEYLTARWALMTLVPAAAGHPEPVRRAAISALAVLGSVEALDELTLLAEQDGLFGPSIAKEAKIAVRAIRERLANEGGLSVSEDATASAAGGLSLGDEAGRLSLDE